MALGLSAYDASVLVAERETADYFEAMLANGADAKAAANWLNNEVFGPPQPGRAVASATGAGQRSRQQRHRADDLGPAPSPERSPRIFCDIVWSEGGDPRAIVEARGMRQVTDTGAIERAIDAVIAANPDKVEEVKAKPKLAAWFVGQVMKADGRKSESGGGQCRSQDATQFARRGVIRAFAGILRSAQAKFAKTNPYTDECIKYLKNKGFIALREIAS